MSLADILSLVDDKLSKVYEKVSYDPAKDRAKFVKRIDATREKFLQTEPARGAKDYSVANGVVRYSPTLSGNPVSVGGKTVLHIPSERFGGDFLPKLKAAVEAGELDAEIEAAANGDKITKHRTNIRTVNDGDERMREPGSGRGWSDERRAAFAATIAARKAAKGEA